jgi:uncharacterized protein (DUF169 family)
MNPTTQSTPLEQLLGLRSPPVAIAFLPAAPAGVAHVGHAEPASCGYWRRAAEGEVFYTEANDHMNCPVGAHTHGVPLDGPHQEELKGLIETMVSLEYLKMEEVASIPHRSEKFGVAVYAPLAQAPVPPDVILVRGTPRQLMLIAEAAQSAGIDGATPVLGRPTCAALPQAMQSERTTPSLGCIGNRVYTNLPEAEAYYAIPSSKLAPLIDKLSTIVHANLTLEQFHKARRA